MVDYCVGEVGEGGQISDELARMFLGSVQGCNLVVAVDAAVAAVETEFVLVLEEVKIGH